MEIKESVVIEIGKAEFDLILRNALESKVTSRGFRFQSINIVVNAANSGHNGAVVVGDKEPVSC